MILVKYIPKFEEAQNKLSTPELPKIVKTQLAKAKSEGTEPVDSDDNIESENDEAVEGNDIYDEISVSSEE